MRDVGIIGLGYVGLPLALQMARSGRTTLGFDVDPVKVGMLRDGQSYISHIEAEEIQQACGSGRLDPTTDFARLAECDAVVICVPTPLTKQREPDLSYVEQTSRSIAATLRPNQLVVLQSTTYPGTTAEVVRPILEATGLLVGRDVFLAYAPEREDPGNVKFRSHQIPKIVGADDVESQRRAVDLFTGIFEKLHPVSGTRSAEMAKLLENIFRSVNIALVNELKVLCDRMAIDVWEVVAAAATKPFGFMAFQPGPGLGGHCIPIDPFYLSWKAREYGQVTRFIELAGEINHAMPAYVVSRVQDELNRRERSLHGAEVLVVGVAYKRDINDIRESPALEVIELLQEKGARVSYHDPYIAELPRLRHYPDLHMRSLDLTAARVASADCVLIITDHTDLDYEMLGRSARLIVDTRNAMARIGITGPSVVRA